MSDGILELFVLGKIPGTEVYIGYVASLVIAVSILVATGSIISWRYYRRIVKRLSHYSPEKLIELISL